MKRFKHILTLCCVLVLTNSCLKLDPVFYSEVSPDNFFDTPSTVYSALSRPFTHWRWFQTMEPFFLNEYPADVLCVPQRYEHWEDGGRWAELHYHTWTPDNESISETWRGIGMGIAMAYAMADDLANLDYRKCGADPALQASHVQQLKTLVAYFYLKGLDFFGGMPIYREYTVHEVPRSSARETFDFIEATLKEAIPQLQQYKKGDMQDGFIRQGAAAAMLAQLYFNAISYIGEDRFAQCATICQDIIDKKYGEYELEADWFGPFDFDNEFSPENIWQAPSENNKYMCTWYFTQSCPYNIAAYLDAPQVNPFNGVCMQPSLRPDGNPYLEWRLGCPFSKFKDTDLRKRPYHYLGNKRYEGAFLYGVLTNPSTGNSCTGNYDYAGEVIELKDIIAPFKQLGRRYETVYDLPSDMYSGEENSGVRVMKYPQPNTKDQSIRWNPDWPVIRLAEVYYMLGECKYRAGDKSGAADMFNAVRRRNFSGADPDPVSAGNIDDYRILDEWMLEFAAEGRRRTDLIRWNKFVTEAWWDHQPSNDNHLKLFPIPTTAMSSSNIITQNPGY